MNTFTTALAGLAFTASAAAAPGAPAFSYSIEDLTTLERITATHERIEDTARAFCHDHLRGTRSLSRSRDCIDAIVEEIVFSIDDARLTAYATTGAVPQELLAGR